MDKNDWDVQMFDYYQSELQGYQNELEMFIKQIDNNKLIMKKQSKQIKLLTNKQTPNLCVICLEYISKYAIIPCGHFCFCEKCNSIVKKKCPICNSNIQNSIKIYFT